MPISFVNATTAAAATVTMPTGRLPGDIEIMWAIRGASTTAPTMPTGAGWQTISTVSRSGTPAVSGRLAWRTCTSSSDTSGTWTNATALICQVYRPSAGTIQPGASATSSSTTATLSFPAITMADGGGNSWVLGFAGASNTTQSVSTPPTGMTREALITASASEAAGHDTQAGVSSWTAQNVNLVSTGQSISAVVELVLLPDGTPPSQLVQMVGGGRNTFAGGDSGNAYKANLPNPCVAGNTLVYWCTFPASATPVITDNNGNTWPAINTTNAPLCNGGTGNMSSAFFVVPNIHAGLTVITCTFGGTITPFSYKIWEFSGVDFTTPINGSSVTPFVAGPTIRAGSYTPGNNNAGGGNILLSVVSLGDNSAPGSEPTMIVPTSPTFLDSGANIYPTDGGFSLSHASSLYLQATSAAINPGFSLVGSTDDYNCISIALKLNSANGGALSINRVFSVLHFSSQHLAANVVYPMICPTRGNTRCLAIMDGSQAAGTVTDSEGNVWTESVANSGFWHVDNVSPNSNLIVYFTPPTGGTANSSIRFYDLTGAIAPAYDTSVAADQTQTFNSTTVCTPTNKASPTTSSGVLISQECLGQGPGLAVTVPSGAIWDLVNYTGQLDASEMDNSDTMSHYYYTASGQVTFTYTITSVASNSCIGGGVIAFKFTTPTSALDASATCLMVM